MTTRDRAASGSAAGGTWACERLAPQQNPHKTTLIRNIFGMIIDLTTTVVDTVSGECYHRP